MRLELEPEEARELLSLIVDRIASETGFGDQDKAQVRRWRSESTRTASEGMRELAAKLNADLERTLRDKEKSAIRKPDWA